MGNKIYTTPNHVIMGVTTNYSLIVHGLAFLIFGGGLLYGVLEFYSSAGFVVSEYIAAIIMFWMFMFHTLALIFLLQVNNPQRRTYGYSVVTVVLEVIGVPAYALLGVIGFGEPYIFVVWIFTVLMLISLIGNIYCVIRHTITK